MSISRPSDDTPEKILEWLSKEKDPANIQNYLTELRQKNYAMNLNVNKPADAICHALTTNNVKSINLKKLKAAKAAIDPGQIIVLILEVIELILKYLESSHICNRNKQAAKQEFIQMLRALNNNPYVNLAKVHISDADLSEVNLKGANLNRAVFKNVNLSNANLQDVNFRDSVFEETTMTGSNLRNANFNWTVFKNPCGCLPITSEINLKSFLQSGFPHSIGLSAVPTVAQLSNTLNCIHDELKCERLNEIDPLKKIQKYHDRHHYRQIMGSNIDKIAQQIKDPQLGYDMMKAVFEHHVFADHKSARTAKMANGIVTGVHDSLFSKKRETPYFGVPERVVHHLNRFKAQLDSRKTNTPKPCPA